MKRLKAAGGVVAAGQVGIKRLITVGRVVISIVRRSLRNVNNFIFTGRFECLMKEFNKTWRPGRPNNLKKVKPKQFMKTKNKTKFLSVVSIATVSSLWMCAETDVQTKTITQPFLTMKSLAFALLCFVQVASADSILPISTATLFGTSAGYNNVLLVGGIDQGDLQFDRFDRTPYISYQLELFNPGSENLGAVDVYGYYATAHGEATALDYNTGGYLGTIQPPSDSSAPWTLDVTTFINTLNFESYSWFGFDIRYNGASGGDQFTSLAVGSPQPQLIAVMVPEPSTVALLGLTAFLVQLTRPLKRGRRKVKTGFNL